MLVFDRTNLEILSGFLSVLGIFGALTRFRSTYLTHSFYGENPFLYKASIVDQIASIVFALVAAVGLFLELIISVFERFIPVSIYQSEQIVALLVIYAFVMLIINFFLKRMALWVARRIWLPKLAASMEKAVNSIWDQYVNKKENDEKLAETIGRLEELFEINANSSDLSIRLNNLKMIVMGPGG